MNLVSGLRIYMYAWTSYFGSRQIQHSFREFMQDSEARTPDSTNYSWRLPSYTAARNDQPQCEFRVR